MRVEIWSDVVCPWCYVGKRRFETALAAFPHRDEVEVVWRSFELDAGAPQERVGDYAQLLADKYGFPVSQGQQMIDTMTQTAAVEGLDLRFDRARTGNTFDAHRLLHLADERGVEVFKHVDHPLPGASVTHLDPRRRHRLEPRQRLFAGDTVVDVLRIVHLPVDRQRDDGVPGDPADFAERHVLHVPQVLEDLQADEQAIVPIGNRPGRSGRVVDDHPSLGTEFRVRAAIHDVGAHDDRTDVRSKFEGGLQVVSLDQLARDPARHRHVVPPRPVIRVSARNGVELVFPEWPDGLAGFAH